MLKLGAAALAAVVLGALLVVLVVNARQKGRLSHCRNNLRRLGTIIHKERLNLVEEPPEGRGRAFWQEFRESEYYNAGRKEWRKKGELNPFGCPVRGVAPASFLEMSDADFARHMTDPTTIDYRGPKAWPTSPSGPLLLASDRDGNHPSGGHVMFADLSVVKADGAVSVRADLWARANQETSD
jgi:hypothetical protein